MHEDAIATIGEEEGDRLVHTVTLRSLRVGNIKMNFLPYFIEFSK